MAFRIYCIYCILHTIGHIIFVWYCYRIHVWPNIVTYSSEFMWLWLCKTLDAKKYRKHPKENTSHISLLLYTAHTATISSKAAVVCSFFDDHTESESYSKHAAVMLRRWPCSGRNKIEKIAPTYDFVWNPSSSVPLKCMLLKSSFGTISQSLILSYNITISVPRTLKVLYEESGSGFDNAWLKSWFWGCIEMRSWTLIAARCSAPLTIFVKLLSIKDHDAARSKYT